MKLADSSPKNHVSKRKRYKPALADYFSGLFSRIQQRKMFFKMYLLVFRVICSFRSMSDCLGVTLGTSPAAKTIQNILGGGEITKW